MSEERDDDQTKRPASPPIAVSPSAASPTGSVSPSAASPPPTPRIPASLDDVRNRVTEAANELLKARLGLEQGSDGGLKFPDRGVFENIGQRADQFMRGFFRGFVAKSPDEGEAAGLRDPKDVPTNTEVASRLLSKVSDTMSSTFHEYLKDHVVDQQHPEEQVVVDGKFLMSHAAPLIASMVQALGTTFSSEGPTESAAEPSVEPPTAPEKPHVDYRVDLPSVFKSLFVRQGDEGDKR